MTLPVTFHRAAREEFIDAADWYQSKRPGLGDEFIAEIERCVTLIAAQPQLYMLKFISAYAALLFVGSHTASTFAPKHSASSCWQSFTAAATR